MLPERIKSKVLVVGECWEWQGQLARPRKGHGAGGYGKIRFQGQNWQAHRLVYTCLRGAIPNGLTVDHLCRNPRCVNPDHMELVPLAVNILRGASFSAANARKTACGKGHAFTPENTYITPAGSRACRACNLDAVNRYRARRSAQ